MLAIKNNLMAVNAARYLGQSYDALATSVERLASGLRINTAKDDAAGMAVREMMRADIAVLEQGSRNAQDGISLLQTMEGAMATIDTCLVRMKQLAEQAATGSYSTPQREIMNSEFGEMADEVERIATSTKFNDIGLLDGLTDEVKIRFGTADDDEISIDGVDMTKEALGIDAGTGSAEYVVGGDGVDSTAAWITVAGGAKDFTIQFGTVGEEDEEAEITATFAIGTYSMELVRDAINDAAGYDAAEIVYDSQTQLYRLKISAQESGDKDYAIGGDFVADSGLNTADFLNIDGSAGGTVNILDVDSAKDALSSVTAAIGLKDEGRAAFGYKMNRLESTVSVLNIQSENLQTAESRISDVDVATEMATLTRNQVLAQAGTAMLAQANSIPQMALTLLR
jgi:flagellin